MHNKLAHGAITSCIVHFFVTGIVNRLNDVEIMRFGCMAAFAHGNEIIQSPAIQITCHLFLQHTCLFLIGVGIRLVVVVDTHEFVIVINDGGGHRVFFQLRKHG